MSEVQFDDLPELGTPAAAVAAIESLIFRAIGAKDLEPLQLRYWLDAYYQARRAQEEDCGPLRASAPSEEAERAPQKYDVIKIRAEDLEEARPVMEIIHDEIRRAAKAAGIEIEDEAEPPMASAPTDETEYSPAPEDAAETQQTAEPAAKAQQTAEGATSSVTAEAVIPSPQGEGKPRQRPVGWTDGFEPVEIKKGPAAEAAAFKRAQFERLQRFLREGVSMQRIVKAAEGNITEDQILGIRECRRVPVAVYRVLEAALDRIETD